jgi:hypothetical protein
VISEHFAAKPEQRLLVVYGDGHIHHSGGTLMSDLEAKLEQARLFVVGTIGQLAAGEKELVARLGDPARPFYLPARAFPAPGPLPGDLFYAGTGPLAKYVDALVYLGAEANRDLSNSLELSAAESAEVARRDALFENPRRLMELRFGRRGEWFRTHPNEIPQRPGSRLDPGH